MTRDELDNEIRNGRYPTREEIAAVQNAEVEAARAQLGPAKAYAAWHLVDKTGVEPTRVVPCCDRGQGWEPTAEEAFGNDLLYARREEGFEHRGQFIKFMRYQLCFGRLDEYHPLSKEENAKRQANRRANAARKKLDKERALLPLFADQIS